MMLEPEMEWRKYHQDEEACMPTICWNFDGDQCAEPINFSVIKRDLKSRNIGEAIGW